MQFLVWCRSWFNKNRSFVTPRLSEDECVPKPTFHVFILKCTHIARDYLHHAETWLGIRQLSWEVCSWCISPLYLYAIGTFIFVFVRWHNFLNFLLLLLRRRRPAKISFLWCCFVFTTSSCLQNIFKVFAGCFACVESCFVMCFFRQQPPKIPFTLRQIASSCQVIAVIQLSCSLCGCDISAKVSWEWSWWCA